MLVQIIVKSTILTGHDIPRNCKITQMRPPKVKTLLHSEPHLPCQQYLVFLCFFLTWNVPFIRDKLMLLQDQFYRVPKIVFKYECYCIFRLCSRIAELHGASISCGKVFPTSAHIQQQTNIFVNMSCLRTAYPWFRWFGTLALGCPCEFRPCSFTQRLSTRR